ncbi:MAG TPA: 2-oxo-4-hydroxy-4-carboxy-5-ureidoimidazoline decarboxylase [Candidatus Limnocylindrales bacterium]|jgi:2-oxo-4-hydroxy-4-carboxy--5-ureidoimidazoline (OHCU) decarboxylase|nr:2-oxo-4-hydroxy-4-carboxy-5-ureidoimidazoline decarboxylase [Candidatus Limnocylindrales bacterium]
MTTGPSGVDVATLDVATLDVAPAREAVAAMAPLFEGAPGFLWRLAAARPFGTPDQLFRRARNVAHNMPEPLQIELIDAHARLGAPPASMSALSFREQGYDAEAAEGLASEAARERDRVAAELDRLNREYEARFGFRYCVFVAGRARAALLPGFETAFAQDREDELHRAIDAVIDIARDRAASAAGPVASSTVSP